MKYICVTHVDAVTGVICTEAPMVNGPVFPDGFTYAWGNQSAWPIACNPDGSYTEAPRYYGTCSDDTDTSVVGVLEVMTEADWNAAKATEIETRKPFASWVWNEDAQSWNAPIPRPADAIINGGTVQYWWDESVVNWAPL